MVMSWGSSEFGQLGLGDDISSDRPVVIPGLVNVECSQVVAGGDSTMVISKDGHLYTFGKGRDGCLGHSSNSNESMPRLVEGISSVRNGSCSTHHMAVTDTNGHLYTWGRDWNGQLGRKRASNDLDIGRVEMDEPVVGTSCGRDHTVVWTEAGNAYSFGSGGDRALGLGGKKDRHVPEKISTLENIKQVSVGSGFSVFLDESGRVYSCGNDGYGRLGNGGGPRFVDTPKPLNSLKDVNIIQISAGEFHAAAVSDKGVLYTWGYGKDGQTGHGDISDVSVPRAVSSLAQTHIVSVECGGSHTAALCKEGDLYVWGKGRQGQLGRGGEMESVAAYKTVPLKVSEFKKSGLVIDSLSLGANHSVAVAHAQ